LIFFFGKHRFPQNKQNNNEFLQILEVLGSLSTISTIVIVPVFFWVFGPNFGNLCRRKKERKETRTEAARTHTDTVDADWLLRPATAACVKDAVRP